MKFIKKECLGCGEIFKAKMKYHKRGEAKYCSLSCINKGRLKIKEDNFKCAYCGVSFYRCESSKNKSKSGLYFCCREHKDLASRIENGFKDIQPAHYGEKKSYSKVDILKLRGGKCEKCGYDKHSEILELHHKDRNRSNNDMSNLEVLCPNCHVWEHYKNKDGRYKLFLN